VTNDNTSIVQVVEISCNYLWLSYGQKTTQLNGRNR
jgi:hypothetical protein